MQLYVIAKKSLIPFISQVEKNAENTGFMHVFPNKVIHRLTSIDYFMFTCWFCRVDY